MRCIKLLNFLLLTSAYALTAQSNFTQPEFFRKQRQLPLLELEVPTKTLKVRDFGAIPGDGLDDLPAINRAMQKAVSMKSNKQGVELVFDPGTYDLYSDHVTDHIVAIRQARNLLVSGNGAELIIRNPQCGFMALFNCKNVIIRDLFIDYDPLPFTQGVIVALDTIEKTFDLKIDEGFPSLGESFFKDCGQCWGVLLDKSIPGKLKDGSYSLYPAKDWIELEPGLFRVKQPAMRYIKSMDLGDPYVQIARNNGHTIFKSSAGENITYLNITSYASPAGSYNAFNHKEWNIIDCKIKLKEGRKHSANADCIHVNGSVFGPWVENCLFEGYTDDAFNLKSEKRHILEVRSPKELVLNRNLGQYEIIRVFNPREGVLLGEAMIMKCMKNADGDGFIVELSQPINGISRIGEDKRNDLVYIDTRSGESFVIRNNTFRNARRYGMLLQNGFGVIENNLFENLSQCAISMNNAVDWGEGLAAHDILIRNNVFKNCGYDATYLSEYNAAAIRMKVNKLKNPESETKWCGIATAPWQGIKNIIILNNTFLYNKRALSVECSENVVSQGNRFIHNQADPHQGKKLDEILLNNNSNFISRN